METISELSFEAAFAELETIITKLEEGELALEESVEQFARGRTLSEHCQALLDKAELRINQLTDSGATVSLE
jgi:exodeoxyribonuclease VII small subunit